MRQAGTCVVGEAVRPTEGRILVLSGAGVDNSAQTLDGHAVEAVCMARSASGRGREEETHHGPTHTTPRRSLRQVEASWILSRSVEHAP